VANALADCPRPFWLVGIGRMGQVVEWRPAGRGRDTTLRMQDNGDGPVRSWAADRLTLALDANDVHAADRGDDVGRSMRGHRKCVIRSHERGAAASVLTES